MTVRIAFIMDPIENININKDTTFAMMLEAQRRDYDSHYLQPTDIWLADGKVFGKMASLSVNSNTQHYYSLEPYKTHALDELDFIFIRKDPPFDLNYVYMTYLLEHVKSARVINNPRSIRDCNEKLFTTWFPQCCPDSLVTAKKNHLREFATKHESIIIKPLDGMGGRSIFHLSTYDPNLNVAIETLTKGGIELVMAQPFIPEITDGDKRVLLINGEPLDYSLARVPAEDDFRGNLAAGATSEGRRLTARDLWIATQVGPTLRDKGLFFVGLDIIGDYLTEINVTSPTCVQELDEIFDLNIAGLLFDALL